MKHVNSRLFLIILFVFMGNNWSTMTQHFTEKFTIKFILKSTTV